MALRIGTMLTGTIDRVGGEFIQTRFFAIGVPLIPLGSFFVMRQGGRGFRIPLNLKSVCWAYVRWLAFAGTVAAAAQSIVSTWSPALCVIMAALWALATFFTNAPGREMLAKRSVFKAATGLSALPAMLPVELAQSMLESLEQSPMHSNPAWAFVVASLRARLQNDAESMRSAERAWSSLAPAMA